MKVNFWWTQYLTSGGCSVASQMVLFSAAKQFLCGYVKSIVYADEHETNDALEENILPA